MSEDKGKKDKKSKKDEVKYFSSSESSITSHSTQIVSVESQNTPFDYMTFEFPVDPPAEERQLSQEHASEAQGACAQVSPKPLISRDSSSAMSPRQLLQSRSPPAKGVSKDSPVTPQKQHGSKSPSTMGAKHKQLKSFTPTKEEERCLLDSESSESSIGKSPEPLQQKTESVPASLVEKRRSSSLPTEASPEVQKMTPADESKRTKSEGQIKPSVKAGESSSPKKRSPLKKALEKCGKVLRFMKVHDKQAKKEGETSTVADFIPELSEESGDGKEKGESSADSNVADASTQNVEPNIDAGEAGPCVAEIAAQYIEPMEEDLEQRNDPDSETPRRSRRLAELGDKSYGGSPSKQRRDSKK